MTVDGAVVLILGGTAEGRASARALHDSGIAVVSSLAGAVPNPALPVGPVRVGGFGGAGGLARFLVEERIRAVVDATHPYAVGMSANAVTATAATGVPLLRLVRPGWGDRPEAGTWCWVDDHHEAASAAAQLSERAFLTIGRQRLDAYRELIDRPTVVRVVARPEHVPPAWVLVEDRGPYRVDGELALMTRHRIGVVVTKDSGGTYTSAKLDAAGRLGIPVVVVRRPPVSEAGGPVVRTVADAVDWVRSLDSAAQ